MFGSSDYYQFSVLLRHHSSKVCYGNKAEFLCRISSLPSDICLHLAVPRLMSLPTPRSPRITVPEKVKLGLRVRSYMQTVSINMC